MTEIRESDRPRFLKYVQKTPTCWNWIGIQNQKGYGRFHLRGKLVSAHRFALQAIGREIPAGMVVDHRCRNRACVNPAHLRIVTSYVNSMENSEGVGARNARKTHCPKGHALEQKPQQRICILCRREYRRRYREKQRQSA